MQASWPLHRQSPVCMSKLAACMLAASAAVHQVFLERLDQNLPGQAPNSILCTPAQVQPVLQRLKTTLTGSGAALLASSVLLFGLIKAGTDADGVYGAAFACPRGSPELSIRNLRPASSP